MKEEYSKVSLCDVCCRTGRDVVVPGFSDLIDCIELVVCDQPEGSTTETPVETPVVVVEAGDMGVRFRVFEICFQQLFDMVLEVDG